MNDEKNTKAGDRGDGRNAGGRFVKGNTNALVHGRRSTRVAAALLPEQAEVYAALREKQAGIIADLGGAETVSVIKSDLVHRYLALSNQAEWLERDLFERGFLTAKGRSRAALSAYLAVVKQLLPVANALGLERRARKVEPLDWLRNLAGASSTASPAPDVSQVGGDGERPASGNVAVDRTKSSPEPDEAAK